VTVCVGLSCFPAGHGNQKRFPDESCESGFFLQKMQHMEQFKKTHVQGQFSRNQHRFAGFLEVKGSCRNPVLARVSGDLCTFQRFASGLPRWGAWYTDSRYLQIFELFEGGQQPPVPGEFPRIDTSSGSFGDLHKFGPRDLGGISCENHPEFQNFEYVS